jgi:glycopeptide antibiotics resistance protein
VAKKKQRSPWMAVLFLCYGALMVYLLFERSHGLSAGMTYWEQVQANCNFTPWHTVGNYWDILTRPEYYLAKWDAGVYRYRAVTALINIAGNIVMFVPLGAFLPAVWQNLQRAWKAIPVGSLSIVVVEICQLLTLRGRCDIDDLLLNVIGIVLGYAGWRLVQFCRRKKKR